eukprot:3441644-Prymnesium_polylepis.1
MSATRGARGCLFPSLVLILCSSRAHPPHAPSARCGLAAGVQTEARRWSADLNELLVVELRSNSTTGSSVPAPDSS